MSWKKKKEQKLQPKMKGKYGLRQMRNYERLTLKARDAKMSREDEARRNDAYRVKQSIRERHHDEEKSEIAVRIICQVVTTEYLR